MGIRRYGDARLVLVEESPLDAKEGAARARRKSATQEIVRRDRRHE
jgi:hypothetical protein